MDQIKKHDFFYGVDWNAIRQIEAPFVPHLRSVTDTSYFPTDDLEQAPEEAPAESSSAGKDLPFLGYGTIFVQLFSTNISIDCSYTFKRFAISSHAF